MYIISVPTDFADMVLLYSERDRGGKFTNSVGGSDLKFSLDVCGASLLRSTISV